MLLPDWDFRCQILSVMRKKCSIPQQCAALCHQGHKVSLLLPCLKKLVYFCFNHYLITIPLKLKAILEDRELNGPQQNVTQGGPWVSTLLHIMTYLNKANSNPSQGWIRLLKKRWFSLFLWDHIIWGPTDSAVSRSHWHHMETVWE